MSSSKVILLGAVSVIFGLYSLSLTRVGSYVGNTAEIALYITKAENNARSGTQRALDLWTRKSGVFSESFSLTDLNGKSEGSFSYSISQFSLGGSSYRLVVTSIGTYKAPGEPASFVGHQVTRNTVADYTDFGGSLNDVVQKYAYSTINYTREHQLDSLQTLKGN